jgi:hypothetical protein
VAEENPLRSATSRMVTAGLERRRGLAGFDAVLEDLGSTGPMDSLNFGLLLADTTAQ